MNGSVSDSCRAPAGRSDWIVSCLDATGEQLEITNFYMFIVRLTILFGKSY